MIWALVYLVLALILTAWAVYSKRSRKLVFTIMTISVIMLGFVKQGCLCSVGAIQNVISAILGNPASLSVAAILLFLIPLIAALIWGRIFCGGVCPLGGMQDLINVTRIKVPRGLDAVLKTVPFIILGAVVFGIIRGDGYLLCKYDFIVPFFRFNASGILLFLGLAGITISTFISRPFCRFLCPYGMLLGGVSFFSRRRVEVSPKKCINCSFCGDVCLVNAIERPDDLVKKESPAKGKIWFAVALILIPLWMYGFSEAGRRVAVPTKTSKQIVSLSEKEILSKKQTTRLDNAIIIAKENGKKGAFVGAVWGLGWGIVLLLLTRRKVNPFFQPDRMNCVACGRCYNHCPQGSPRGAPPKLFDTVLGHIRHRIKSDSNKVEMIISKISILVGVSIIVLSALLVRNDMLMTELNPLKQPKLKKLQVAIKMDLQSVELKKEYKDLSTEIRDGYNKVTRIHEKLMIATILLFILLAGLLKYRHNRFVLPNIKPKVDKTTHSMGHILIARFSVIGIGLFLLLFLLKQFPSLPL